MEESDIHRSNVSQWKFADRNLCGKFWEAIVALGLVDVEGRNKLISIIESLEKGRVQEGSVRKELNKGAQ